MSSIVNKVKDALHSDKSTSNTTTHNTHSTTSGAPEGTYGPHGSRVANAADPRVDSDRDGSHAAGRTAGHGEYGSSGLGHTTGTHTGTHAAGSGMTGTHTSGTREGEHGPHGSRIANAMDPRVDSDRDGSRNAGAAYGTGSTGHNIPGGQGFSSSGAAYQGSGGLGSAHHTTTSGTREGEHGPHGSRVANALDPRVDSDRDGSRNAGAAYGGSTTGHHTTTGTGAEYGSSTMGTGHHTAGHNTAGYGAAAGSGVTGMTGTHGAPTGTYGTHNSRVANAADPRIDSDRDGRAAVGHNAPGPAPNTAGPHKSDMLNKMDPRVDSDMDGSKTAGGNKTYQ